MVRDAPRLEPAISVNPNDDVELAIDSQIVRDVHVSSNPEVGSDVDVVCLTISVLVGGSDMHAQGGCPVEKRLVCRLRCLELLDAILEGRMFLLQGGDRAAEARHLLGELYHHSGELLERGRATSRMREARGNGKHQAQKGRDKMNATHDCSSDVAVRERIVPGSHLPADMSRRG